MKELQTSGGRVSSLNRRQFLQSVGSAAGVGLMGSLAGYTACSSKKDIDDPESYWPEPKGTFEERRRVYLEYSSKNAVSGRNGIFCQIARLDLEEEPIDEAVFREAIEFVYSNRDCNDFVIGGLLRILYLYRESPMIPRQLISDIEECVLRFKYWWDEPGRDKRCYHTENHQIIFHSDELLAGQLFPEKVFANSSKTGREHVEKALHFIRRWIDFRVKFGFSEWLSNCYFDHDLMALVNLHDFAEAEDVRVNAAMLIDILLFEMALHSYRGVFGSTHGRTYARMIKSGRGEHTASIVKLMFGMGVFSEPDSLGTVALATGGYRCPPVLTKIAADLQEPILSKERHSINIEDAPKYGLSYDSIEDCHLYWSIQDYIHPSILELSRNISERYGVRQFEDYDFYARQYQEQEREFGRIVNPDLCHKALTEVHIQTYRTGDYMLSCAQDYRPGCGGYQQHIWQATIGLDAVVFTNHPGSDDEGGRPNFWAGNGTLPRAAQHKNVLICIHHVAPDDPFPSSHAYFPKDAFDEVIEQGNWVVACKGDGYVALYSQNESSWRTQNGVTNELRVSSPNNIWICELGSKKEWKSFARFKEAVTKADVACLDTDVDFQSPSQGYVSFGWNAPLCINGKEIPLQNYPRFDNPYCQSKFTDPHVDIKRGKEGLLLDFENVHRKVI